MNSDSGDREPLGTLAEKITRVATEADSKTLEAATLLSEARQRIEDGELPEVSWTAWVAENIKLSESRLRELQRIAGADDPAAELERIRAMTRERVQRHRDKQKSAALRNAGPAVSEPPEIEEGRRQLIGWARQAPMAQLDQVLAYIKEFDPNTSGGPDVSVEAPITGALTLVGAG